MEFKEKQISRLEYNFDGLGGYETFIVGKKRVKSITEVCENIVVVEFSNGQKTKVNTNFITYYKN